MSTIRIFIADDHTLVRSGLRLLLTTQDDMQVVGESGNTVDACQQIALLRPDILLLDISMPGGACLDTIRELRGKYPEMRMIVVTMHENSALLQRCLDVGADGVVVKSAADSDLLNAIREVRSGNTYISTGQSGGFDSFEHHDVLRGLSAREREVLKFLVRGHTNQAVAEQLGIGVKSVESYRARMMSKLGVSSRAELVDLAVRAGIFFESSPVSPNVN